MTWAVERLIGQPEFEQARGVIMELCNDTAPEALPIFDAIAGGLSLSIEQCVALVRAAPMEPDLRDAVLAYCN
jgi:hypothetical protein